MTSVESAPRELKHNKKRPEAAAEQAQKEEGKEKEAEEAAKATAGKKAAEQSTPCDSFTPLPSSLSFSLLLSLSHPSLLSLLLPFTVDSNRAEKTAKAHKKRGAKIISILTAIRQPPPSAPPSAPFISLRSTLLPVVSTPSPTSHHPPVTLKYHLQSLSASFFRLPAATPPLPLCWRLKST